MSAPSRLIISNMATGFETDREPFLLSNDAFPVLQNAFIWRGRLQKKRGTTKLGRLTRKIGTTDGAGNFSFTLTNAPIAPFTAIFTVGTVFYQDTGVPAGPPNTIQLTTNGVGTTATLNLTSGVLSIFTGPINTDVLYTPGLPVMGIEDLEVVGETIDNAPTIFFDTKYAYQFDMTSGVRQFYDVSFYKITGLPVIWHGADYQQFWSANFDNAMFVTNNVPGLNGVQIATITNANNPVLTTVTPHNLATNDWIYIDGVTQLFNPAYKTNNISFVNGLSLQVNVATTVILPASGVSTAVTATITGPSTIQLNGINASTAASPGAGGFLQELTRETAGQDGIRWYDGDPTVNSFAEGWVNFAPPINKVDPKANPAQVQTYLVGALMLLPFRGTFIAFGTWEQAANSSTPLQYPQRIRWSTFSGTPFYSMPVPQEETADPLAWVENVNGRGGHLDIITAEDIVSATNQQETVLLGMERTQRRLVPTGSVINPFTTQIVNPEFGTNATFSGIALDKGTLSVGDYGFILATSYNAQRFDTKIPDQAFQVKQLILGIPTGPNRICSARNFQEETICFTFVDLSTGQTYPNRSVLFNYRDPSFSIMKESYTTYGQFRDSEPNSWLTLNKNGQPLQNWFQWLPNWISYEQEPGYPQVAGGNQEGYVMLKEFDTVGNHPSLAVSLISNIVSGINPDNTTATFTIVNHNLEIGDYFFLQFAQGFTAVPPSTNINGTIWKVLSIPTANTLTAINFTLLNLTGSYTGQGEISILDNFLVQTKQIADFWQMAGGVRLGTQRYLLDKTDLGEFTATLLISQDSNDPASANPWNVSTNIVRTRPDDSLGIRGSEVNQAQIWHRNSNSVLGDSVQMQFSMTDAQMQQFTGTGNNMTPSVSIQDWVLHAMVIDLYKSRILA